MKFSLKLAIAAASVSAGSLSGAAIAESSAVSIPSVVVTVENSAPSRGGSKHPSGSAFTMARSTSTIAMYR